MPGLEHNATSQEFLFCVYNEIRAMNLENEIDSLRSSTMQIGNWRKEADECWGPSTQNLQLNAVLEIGLSESSQRLALDAHGSLEANGSTFVWSKHLNLSNSLTCNCTTNQETNI
jgi:hypothetical protein